MSEGSDGRGLFAVGANGSPKSPCYYNPLTIGIGEPPLPYAKGALTDPAPRSSPHNQGLRYDPSSLLSPSRGTVPATSPYGPAESRFAAAAAIAASVSPTACLTDAISALRNASMVRSGSSAGTGGHSYTTHATNPYHTSSMIMGRGHSGTTTVGHHGLTNGTPAPSMPTPGLSGPHHGMAHTHHHQLPDLSQSHHFLGGLASGDMASLLSHHSQSSMAHHESQNSLLASRMNLQLPQQPSLLANHLDAGSTELSYQQQASNGHQQQPANPNIRTSGRPDVSTAEKIISEIVGEIRQEAEASTSTSAFAGVMPQHLHDAGEPGNSGSLASRALGGLVRLPTTYCTPGASAPLSKAGRKRGRPSRSASPGVKPFTCTFCSKGFYQKNQLLQHERIHTDERPYPCIYCERRFKQQSHKMQHERIHTGEKPYICPICERRFRQKNHLDSHYRGHFGPSSAASRNATLLAPPSLVLNPPVIKDEPASPPDPLAPTPNPTGGDTPSELLAHPTTGPQDPVTSRSTTINAVSTEQVCTEGNPELNPSPGQKQDFQPSSESS